jgi:hypothetical protein
MLEVTAKFTEVSQCRNYNYRELKSNLILQML